MIKIYGPRFGSSMRNHWLLHEIGVAYEAVAVDMKNREHKQEPFLKLNPTGQVPVMVEDDFILTESLAINNYLAERFKPEMVGKEEKEKAAVWQWSLWATYTVQKHLGAAMMQIWTGVNDQSIIAKELQDVEKYMHVLNNHLAGKDFLAGNMFTVADINVAVVLTYAMPLKYDFSQFPHVQRWFQAMLERPGYKNASEQQ